MFWSCPYNSANKNTKASVVLENMWKKKKRTHKTYQRTITREAQTQKMGGWVGKCEHVDGIDKYLTAATHR